jgi:hypothetical protein
MSQSEKKYVGRTIWGPKAWHLLHAFSIGMNKPIQHEERKCYFLFYKTFAELIPCAVCKAHYIDYFHYIYTIEEREIERTSIKHYVHELHNIINEELGKKKISFQKAMMIHKKTIHSDIFFFMNHAILQYLKLDLSLEEYDRFYTFFVCFCKLYPDPFWRNALKRVIECPQFQNLKTPKQFLTYYQNTFLSQSQNRNKRRNQK